MILVCSRGCRWDTTHPLYRHMQPGDRCPNVLTYDRINGTTYCRRRLKMVTQTDNMKDQATIDADALVIEFAKLGIEATAKHFESDRRLPDVEIGDEGR